ncbi:hypothetical protein J6590_029803 [Homalodisca vitripennis]|nr:hypothetical protein J6590_029803 [Homalodisca vitripennis]
MSEECLSGLGHNLQWPTAGFAERDQRVEEVQQRQRRATMTLALHNLSLRPEPDVWYLAYCPLSRRFSSAGGTSTFPVGSRHLLEFRTGYREHSPFHTSESDVKQSRLDMPQAQAWKEIANSWNILAT